jgi:hypothetical protein
MIAMTCHEAQEQLDLLAAGECDRPTQQAIERHLATCRSCAASYAESQRLLGLLELHWNTAGPQRLRERIEHEARRPRRRAVVLPFANRAAALAAMLLVMLGLSWVAPSWQTPDGLGVEVAARGRSGMVGAFGQPQVGPVPEVAKGTEFAEKSRPAVVVLPDGEKGEAFRRRLRQAARAGKLPTPPAVPLSLTLKNSGPRPVTVRLGDAVEELELDVRGEGVVRLPAARVAAPEVLRARTFVLAPGEQYVFPIERLIAGARGRLEYIYLTEPGKYVLTARWRVTVSGQVVTVLSEPMPIIVEE